MFENLWIGGPRGPAQKDAPASGADQQREWVNASSIHQSLPPRSRKRRFPSSSSSGSPPSSTAAASKTSNRGGSASLADTKLKHVTDNRNIEDNDNDDSEEEVEFLLTILPPSPKKQQANYSSNRVTVTPMPTSANINDVLSNQNAATLNNESTLSRQIILPQNWMPRIQ
jgi:hypothetical protein